MDERERHLRIAEIFSGAVDLPMSERDAFLERECGGDTELERDVRSVLMFDRAESLSPTGLPHSEPVEETDRTGQMVGRYRIVERLGKGGMGVVWRAEDPVLRRNVAIKFLPAAQRESETARRRFLREARAASVLTNPGIAGVLDVGEIEGAPYIAMQMVEGRTVRECVRDGGMTPVQAVRIAARVAEILEDAHAHHVIHRDITSSNIIVQPDGTPRVVDFGVARRTTDTSRLSKTGVTVGTIGFIAPEVIEGEDATAQSDVFSLGVVLYEMLTGRLPFEFKRIERVLHATLTLDPEPPRRLAPAIPRELERIVMKALSRRRDRRYASARELAGDLQAVLESGTLKTAPGRIVPGRLRIVLAILVLLALAVVTAGLLRHHGANGGASLGRLERSGAPFTISGPGDTLFLYIASGGITHVRRRLPRRRKTADPGAAVDRQALRTALRRVARRRTPLHAG